MKLDIGNISPEYRTEILHRSVIMAADVFGKFHRLQMSVYPFGDSGDGGVSVIEPFEARPLVAIKNILFAVCHNGFKHRTGKVYR